MKTVDIYDSSISRYRLPVCLRMLVLVDIQRSMKHRTGRGRGIPYSVLRLAIGAVLILVAVYFGGGSRTHFQCYGFTVSGGNVHRKTSVHALEKGEGSGNNNDENDGIPLQQRRRVALNNMFRNPILAIILTARSSSSTTALALDMDAFESNILSKDTTNDLSPKLNDDEALCKYGAPGKAMGEACSRAKIQRKLPGKVDATGKVDRGDYLKCRYEYPIIGGEYVKTRVCKQSGEEW